MGSNVLRRRQLKLCYDTLRETQSLLRKTCSPKFRRKYTKIIRALDNCLKMSHSYESDLSKLRDNNVNLARAVQNEKENSKNFLQDKIVAESSYHELLKEHICIKRDLQNLEKVILAYEEELRNSMIPNLVRLSDDITKFKFKNDVIKKMIESRGNGDATLPKNSWSNGVNFGTNGNQPVSAVNPMIKGCVIQKPTINVRRVSIPHEMRTSLFAHVDISSPILEEPEEPLETVTNRTRKCKNGLRHVLTLSNTTVCPPIQSVAMPEISFRNGSEEINSDVNLRMEPVVRLSDVTRMLQNSSYRISESQPETPTAEKRYSSPVNHQFTPGLLLKRCETPKPCNDGKQLPEDNPLEGCSWMFRDNSPSHLECTPPRISVVRTSNSIINQEKASRNSTLENSPAATQETVEKRQSLFREPSLPNSDFLIRVNRKDSSYNPRVSTAFSNDLSSAVKENTFLSSTLNSGKKKKFFSMDNESSVFFTTRRKLVKSLPGNEFLELDNASLEDSFQSRQTEDTPSSDSHVRTEFEVSTSNISADGEKRVKKSRTKRSNQRNKKKKMAEHSSSCTPETPVQNISIRTETFSIRLEDCNRSKKKSSASKLSKLRGRRSFSDRSDSCGANDTDVTSTETGLNSFDTSGTARSLRKRTNISYKEPDLARKLRR